VETPRRFDHTSLCPILLGSALGFCVWLGPREATAETTEAGWLVVDRTEGVTDCPAASELRQAAERLLEEGASPSRTVRVTFVAASDGYMATVEHQDSPEETRTLLDPGTSCATLSEAVVTALVLWIEADVREQKASAPTPPPPRPAAPASVERTKVEERRAAQEPEPRSSMAWEVAVSGGAAFGVVNDVAPFLAGSTSLTLGRFRSSLGAFWVLPEEVEVPPGSVRAELVGGSARLCGELLPPGGVELWGCTGLYAGVVSARARDFTENSGVHQPWLGVPVELSLGARFAESRAVFGTARLGATGLVPLVSQSFSVEGKGALIEPWRVGALVWIELGGGLFL
jgi:hypothetical protein